VFYQSWQTPFPFRRHGLIAKDVIYDEQVLGGEGLKALPAYFFKKTEKLGMTYFSIKGEPDMERIDLVSPV